MCYERLDANLAAGTAYAASVQTDVTDWVPDVLLAHEMNVEMLLRDHEYPMRAFVLGIVGAACVKWVGMVVLLKKKSYSHQQRQYC